MSKAENTYTAIIKKSGEWYIGWIKEVPGVNCQERDLKTLKETLKITLEEILEINRQNALSGAGTDFHEEKIAIPA